MISAFSVIAPWSLDDLYEDLSPSAFLKTHERAAIVKKYARALTFPNAPSPSSPATYLDKDGFIFWWFLPGILRDQRQSKIHQDTTNLALMEDKERFRLDDGIWTTESDLYRPLSRCKAGYMDVCLESLSSAKEPVTGSPPPVLPARDECMERWFGDMVDSLAVLSSITAITQPQIWEASFQVIESMHNGKLLCAQPSSILSQWAVPFSRLEVLIDGSIPLHLCPDLPPDVYSLFAATGTFKNARFLVPLLGSYFPFTPGTVMVGNASLLEHGFSTADGASTMFVGSNSSDLFSKSNLYHQSQSLTVSMMKQYFWEDRSRKTTWALRDYSQAIPENPFLTDAARVKMAKQFPPPERLRMVETEAVRYSDCDNVSFWWYLPGILQSARRETVVCVTTSMQKKTNPDLWSLETGQWWAEVDLYTHFDTSAWQPGFLRLAPAEYWHSDEPSLPKPSLAFREESPSIKQWLNDMLESFAILSSITALTQPEIWEAGFQVLEGLHNVNILCSQPEIVRSTVSQWGMPFTSLDIIANGSIPLHCDMDSPNDAYELLAAFGSHTCTRFSVPALGAGFAYDPGTVMVGAGRWIEHGCSTSNGPSLGLVAIHSAGMIPKCSLYHQARPTTSDVIHKLFYEAPVLFE
ncbi:hypothetical protein BKA70DRAFT_1452839 [Coprinopsis sp. MPI-PUGE-AT-0042]|nr:hypothetical protein BKA70DRAFT_1452839 [Coprinopsis sp. MPI-PUGE-AT-0042]